MLQPLEHSVLIKKVPPIVRFLRVPILYNYWYWRACMRVLRERTRELVDQAWQATGIPGRVIEAVARIVRDELWWPARSLFVPGDECFVLFGCWRQEITDGLELPVCILEIERELNVVIPEELMKCLPDLRFAEFCSRIRLLML